MFGRTHAEVKKPPIRVDGADPSYLNPPNGHRAFMILASFLDLEKILSLLIGDEKKGMDIFKNLKRVIGLNRILKV